VGGIISFWWAASFRYDGRHHLVLVGGFARNQHIAALDQAIHDAVIDLNRERIPDPWAIPRISA
jgi:hypothetical protein